MTELPEDDDFSYYFNYRDAEKLQNDQQKDNRTIKCFGQSALISTISNPRYKDLNFLPNTLRLQTESYLHTMYDDLNFELNPINLEESTTKKSSTKQSSNEDSIFNALFGSESYKKETNEVNSYLNEYITEKPDYTYNPYKW
ncbi:hypothetical protein RclHR1_05850007 [Rhizophagus clarus]|uniref:Uncharacterized protein n=1 Tax=Rhizophagus clarus TaxID=94130 RepID=A0A2Z6RNZ4_9GLOM|nr:hypothetical protein RclHR1_05850007 [Rhizophagus clarus]GES74690.1 hypothetical protein GLOIN_2v1788913 [Rhizophagus clarus]